MQQNAEAITNSRRHPEGARIHQRAEGSRVEQNEPRTVFLYPEHGTGRAAKLRTCQHCGGKPLIVRKCGRNRSCAVCQKCGYHHRTKLS